jgi:hypothetical protein
MVTNVSKMILVGLFGVRCVDGRVKPPHGDTQQDAYNKDTQYDLRIAFCMQTID